MLARGNRRLVFIAGAILIAFSLLFTFNDNIQDGVFPSKPISTERVTVIHEEIPQTSIELPLPTNGDQSLDQATHRELFSLSPFGKKFFSIDFGDHGAFNPNIIPHPHLNETWIIVAVGTGSDVEKSVWHVELACNARFDFGVLKCLKPPTILPIAGTPGDNCPKDDDSGMAISVGPHDARVFYGPTIPFTMYGSNSGFTCFGLFMVDFRLLVDWGFEDFKKGEYRAASELQKPGGYQVVEKNWFVFWDTSGQKYIHHNILPRRGFAKLENDGSVGKELALKDSPDEVCLEKYVSHIVVDPKCESLHQSTNSLSITLCKRSDPACVVNDTNTFIFHIFQHKKFYFFHSTYEPYIMLFERKAPFKINAISTKPFWIHGRGNGLKDGKVVVVDDKDAPRADDMFYVTSISWKAQGQKYHGYIDDVIFLAFGIEDAKSGGIDVLAGDLLQDLAYCSKI